MSKILEFKIKQFYFTRKEEVNNFQYSNNKKNLDREKT